MCFIPRRHSTMSASNTVGGWPSCVRDPAQVPKHSTKAMQQQQRRSQGAEQLPGVCACATHQRQPSGARRLHCHGNAPIYNIAWAGETASSCARSASSHVHGISGRRSAACEAGRRPWQACSSCCAEQACQGAVQHVLQYTGTTVTDSSKRNRGPTRDLLGCSSGKA